MNTEQEELSINYKGVLTKVTPSSNATDTFFTVHLPENDLQLKIEDIDDNPCWVEDGGGATERATELGRLIEEFDGR